VTRLAEKDRKSERMMGVGARMGTGTGTRRLWVILMIGSLFWHHKVSTCTYHLTTTDREAHNKTLRWVQGKWTCVWGESRMP